MERRLEGMGLFLSRWMLALCLAVLGAGLLLGGIQAADNRRALVLASGYLLAVAAFNRAFHTNYLFLSAAPAGTPLRWLASRGGAFYVCALALLCMTAMRLLAGLYGRAATSGSR